MTIAVCVDSRGGMAFGGRRQSRDRVLRQVLLELAGDAPIWMNGYSARQFSDHPEAEIHVSDHFLEDAPENGFCFAETESPLPWLEQAERVILVRWNRLYPSDLKFFLPREWKLRETRTFPGSSHPAITLEVYGK